MDPYEALQRDLNQVIEGVNNAILALQRVVPALGIVGHRQCQEAEQLAASLRDIEDDLIVLLDTVEERADQASQAGGSI